ncbi:MAG: EamA family transporter, partial [Candidatus Eisenbacteria bacterium]|nr:EamA family transporter [Candidatus Eisenbacteria bacterium]
LSLVAVTYTKAGVAATLMAIVPILVLPLVRWVFKERITARAFVGALIAVLGVAILTLG